MKNSYYALRANANQWYMVTGQCENTETTLYRDAVEAGQRDAPYVNQFSYG